jgi:hypothetical protein
MIHKREQEHSCARENNCVQVKAKMHKQEQAQKPKRKGKKTTYKLQTLQNKAKNQN